jgi:hypothetical protein
LILVNVAIVSSSIITKRRILLDLCGCISILVRIRHDYVLLVIKIDTNTLTYLHREIIEGVLVFFGYYDTIVLEAAKERSTHSHAFPSQFSCGLSLALVTT